MKRFMLLLIILTVLTGCVHAPNKAESLTATPEHRELLLEALESKNKSLLLTPSEKDRIYNRIHDMENVIYGFKDDRKDYYQVRNKGALRNAEAVASSWNKWQLVDKKDGTYQLTTMHYGRSNNLWSKEPFYNQPIGAHCTAFLVSPTMMVTAGHCINLDNIEDIRFVFGFRMTSKDTAVVRIPAKDIYKAKRLVAHKCTSRGLDYAVFELDRPCRDRLPVSVCGTNAKKGESLYVIGYPTGLPQKVADGARVLGVSRYTFRANLDTYGGNSGSPVFNDRNECVGILVKGATDYIEVNGRMRSNRIQRGYTYKGEQVTRCSLWRKYIR